MLQLFPRRRGQALVGDDGSYVLQAEDGWLLTGSPDALDTAAASLVGISERITDEVLLLAFGNAVGVFDVPGLGRLEVVSGKWRRTDYDRMLADLTDIAAGLPFAAGAVAALPYDRAVVGHEDVLYHMLVYLRHVLSDAPPIDDRLLPSLRLVVHEPHRRFEQTRRRVSIDQAQHVDSGGLVRVAAGLGGFAPAPSALAARSGLVRSLRGYVPEWIDERRVQSTLDTAENRFVKAFLQSAIGVIDRMGSLAAPTRDSDPFGKRIASDCEHLTALLRPVMEHPIWQDVGPMIHLPASSTVLQQRRGYREVYHHFAKMRLAARVPLRADLVRDLLEAKDIAQLYEVWCFFTFARELAALLGRPQRADGPRVGPLQVSVPWEIECVWPDGTRLLYNPRFSRSRLHLHSFSVPLRPDIALEVAGGPNAGLHLFDAKFKVDQLGSVMPLDESGAELEAEEAEEWRGTFKRGDLYKMHAYRDAIPGARSVWILYPGTDVRFFAESQPPVTTSESLPPLLQGVGAVPARPGDGHLPALRTVLGRLLSRVQAPSALPLDAIEV